MTLIHLLIVLAVLAAVAAVAAGKVRGGLPEPTSTRPDLELVRTRLATARGHRGTRTSTRSASRSASAATGWTRSTRCSTGSGLELGAREEEIRELREQLAGGPERVAGQPEPPPSRDDDRDPDLPPAG